MTAQLCPRCRQIGLTWSIDEEESPLTQWHCSLCEYVAWEDESKEQPCHMCGRQGSILIEDESGTYRYCFACGGVGEGAGPRT
jgi:phage/plasmid primase-like uncharacterized protein